MSIALQNRLAAVEERLKELEERLAATTVQVIPPKAKPGPKPKQLNA